MPSLPASEYVEVRDGRGYYVAGTRVGLHVIIDDFREGRTPEAILESYPSIGSLGKVYGTIAFILEHPEAIAEYLREVDASWDQFCKEHPIPDEMLDRFRRTQNEMARRPA